LWTVDPALRGCAEPLAGRGRSTGIRAYGVRGSYWDNTEAIILDVLYGDTTPLIDEIDFVFERRSGLGGRNADIIANDGAEGQQIVEILPTDVAFQTKHCQPWEKIG
jgi:hypothetical protein